jgi:thiol-disulfide isomerase/thioredoxin
MFLLAAACLAVASVAVLSVATVSYSPAPGSRNGAACEAAARRAPALAQAATGEVAAFKAAPQPVSLAALGFAGPEGQPLSLASFSGKVVLLNLWATWCAPCRKEMPALDALQGALGGPGFEVVAVNIDTRNLDKPRAWLADNGISRLAYFADSEARIFQDLRRVGLAIGMPTTLLVDGEGCALGVLHGAAEWNSADAHRLIEAALAR